MPSSFFKGLVLPAMICISAFSLSIENLYAQGLPEPSLAGVTYRELAEWDAMYGRGRFYGGGGYHPEFYGPPYGGDFCPPEPPPASKTQKLKSREGRK